MDKLIFQDKVGNKILERYVKTRNIKQYVGKNAQGRILNPNAFNSLAREAKLKIGRVRTKGINKVREHY